MLRWCFAQPDAEFDAEPVAGDLGDMLVGFFRRVTSDPRWLRLLQWEALGDEPIDDENRRAHYRGLVAFAEQGKADGWFPADLDADLLFLTLQGAAEYPSAYPTAHRAHHRHPQHRPGVRRDATKRTCASSPPC